MDNPSAHDASERRRTPREPAGWYASYKLVGPAEMPWSLCRVVDVSSAGVGLELYGPHPRHGTNERLIVRVEPHGDTDTPGIELPGIIRNTATVQTAGVRVGVEFVGLSAEARQFLITQAARTPSS